MRPGGDAHGDRQREPWAMSTTATISPPSTRRATGRRMRPVLRKGVLVLHILSAGAWVGIDVVVGALVLVGMLSEDPATAGLAYQALGTFVVGPMLASALLCLGTGLLLGLGTKWGLARYWWVLVKLVLTLVLTVLVVVALSPEMPEAVRHGEQLAAGSRPNGDVSDLAFPPIVSLLALSFATVLSVYKPWGRIRRQR